MCVCVCFTDLAVGVRVFAHVHDGVSRVSQHEAGDVVKVCRRHGLLHCLRLRPAICNMYCMYVCIYMLRPYIRMFVHTYIHACMHVCIYVCMYVCMYVFL
jgi:hypothetical protein